MFRDENNLPRIVIGVKIGIPLSPFSHREKVRMRVIKGFLAIENFRVLVTTSMDDSDRSEEYQRYVNSPHRASTE